tara:strand:+ start:863 stop:1192 length:330 start_codon:yes stop_codon:yes gene_type:complete
MTTEKLLRILDDSRWDKTIPFEILKIKGYKFYRYMDSILLSPKSHFHVATKYSSRGKGYAEELIKRVFNITKYMMTTISCDNIESMERLLTRIGFEWDDYYKTWNLEKK